MIKLKSLLKAKQGTTLVELVAAMLIFSMIMTTVSFVMVPILNLYNRTNQFAEMNTLLDNVVNELTGELSSAQNISFTDGGDTLEITSLTGVTKYSVKEHTDSKGTVQNILFRNDTTLALDSTFYKDKSISIKYFHVADDGTRGNAITSAGFPVDSEKKFYITVTIFDKDNITLISRDYAVNPLGLNTY